MILLFSMMSKYSSMESLFEKLKRDKVTVAQAHLMLMLASRGDEFTKMKDLVNHMEKKRQGKIGQTAVSKAVKNLGDVNRYGRKGHGFLETKQDDDGRYLLIRLNKEGFAWLNKTFNL